MIPQRDLSGPVLAGHLLGLLGDEARLDAMAAAAKRMGRPDAAARIADLVVGLMSPARGPAEARS